MIGKHGWALFSSRINKKYSDTTVIPKNEAINFLSMEQGFRLQRILSAVVAALPGRSRLASLKVTYQVTN